MWWNKKESKSLFKYNLLVISALIVLLIVAIIFKRNIYILPIASIVSSISIFWLFSKYLKKSYGLIVNQLILVVFITICIKIFDGAFLNVFYRFFLDTLVFLFGGIYLLNNKKLRLGFNEMILLLFAPPSLIYVPLFVTTIPNFGVLLFSLPLSLVFIWIYTLTNRKLIVFVCAILFSAIVSFFIYPNYWSYLEGNEYQTAQKMDERLKLNVVQKNGDTTSLQSLGNKIIVLDVWYSGCGICFKKFPEFQKLSNSYQSDSNIYFATLNVPLQEELDSFNSFELIKQYSFHKLQATATTDENKWGIERGYPTILIFDKSHHLRYSGTLNTDKTILLNNTEKIIEKLKKE